MKSEIELDDLRLEIRDYKAAVKYMHMLYTQQMQKYHRHLKKDHGDVRHRARWQDCPSEPCVVDREDLAKVEALMNQYRLPGDPRGTPEGAAFQTDSAKAVANRRIRTSGG